MIMMVNRIVFAMCSYADLSSLGIFKEKCQEKGPSGICHLFHRNSPDPSIPHLVAFLMDTKVRHEFSNCNFYCTYYPRHLSTHITSNHHPHPQFLATVHHIYQHPSLLITILTHSFLPLSTTFTHTHHYLSRSSPTVPSHYPRHLSTPITTYHDPHPQFLATIHDIYPHTSLVTTIPTHSL